MSLYDNLMESVIYEDSIEEYKERVLREGLFQKEYITVNQFNKIEDKLENKIIPIAKKYNCSVMPLSLSFDIKTMKGKKITTIGCFLINKGENSVSKFQKMIDEIRNIKISDIDNDNLIKQITVYGQGHDSNMEITRVNVGLKINKYLQ